jgi:hypothetical protein
MTSFGVSHLVEVEGERVGNAIASPPEVANNLVPLVKWIITLANAIMLFVTGLITMLAQQIELRLVKTLEQAAATQPAAASITSTPSKPNVRCSKCHARGHTADTCKTADPSAMRKRVARNSRIAKEVRYD